MENKLIPNWDIHQSSGMKGREVNQRGAKETDLEERSSVQDRSILSTLSCGCSLRSLEQNQSSQDARVDH